MCIHTSLSTICCQVLLMMLLQRVYNMCIRARLCKAATVDEDRGAARCNACSHRIKTTHSVLADALSFRQALPHACPTARNLSEIRLPSSLNQEQRDLSRQSVPLAM